jgi:hypothetical protein
MLAANLGIRFLIELAALVALGVFGAHVGGGGLGSIVLAAGLPLVGAILWGAFASPKAAIDVPALKIATEVLVLGGAAVALAVVGSAALGAAFAGVVLVNAALLAVLAD